MTHSLDIKVKIFIAIDDVILTSYLHIWKELFFSDVNSYRLFISL